MKNPGINSIAVNSLYLSSAKTITSFARIIYAVLLARFLGAELYGMFNYGLSWYIIFVPISALGLDSIILRDIGADRAGAYQLIGRTLALRSISSIVISLVCFLVGWLIETNPVSRQLLVLFSFALFGRGLSLWTNAVFSAHEVSQFVFRQEVVFRLLEVIGGIAVLMTGFGVLAVATVHAACWLMQGASGIFLIRRFLVPVTMQWDLSELIVLIKRGIPFAIRAFLTGWLLLGPILMYRHFKGIGDELGQLALAMQAFYIVGAVFGEMGAAALPVLSRSVARRDDKTNRYLDIVLRGGSLLGGGLAICALGAGPWVINLLFGGSYEQAITLLPWSLILVGPYFWMITLSGLVVAHGKYWTITGSSLTGAVVFILGFVMIVPFFDMMGAILSLGAGFLSSVVVLLTALFGLNHISFISMLAKSILAVSGAVSICYWLVSANNWLALTAGIITLFLFSILLGVIKKREIYASINFFLIPTLDKKVKKK